MRIDGCDIVESPLEAKRRLAFMPDEPHLFEYLTVIEHLGLVGRVTASPTSNLRARVLLEELDLTGKENERCPESCRAACGRRC